MKIYLIDFETRSMVPIQDPEYTLHETTKIICMSYGLRGSGEVKLWWASVPLVGIKAMPLPRELLDHVAAGGMIGASNAPFDEAIWNYIGVNDYDFPPTKPEQWYCTQAEARVAGLPSSLANSALAVGAKYKKDPRGTALIKKCSVAPYSEDIQDYKDFGAYCLKDSIVMEDVSLRIPDLNAINLRDYHLNEEINQRGIMIDVDLARAAMRYAEAEREEIAGKLYDVTCGAVEKSTQHARFKNWLLDVLQDDGCEEGIKLMTRYVKNEKKYSSDKVVRANLQIAHNDNEIDLADDVVEALQLMDDAGGSATAKFTKMARKADPQDDRVRGILRFAGAQSTQRFSSLDLQVHNFRRDALSPEETEHYKALMLAGEDLVDMDGNPVRVMDTLGRMLRCAIIPKPGHVLVIADWSAVESRMTAGLAGDEDKLNIFRAGGDVYCHIASGHYGREITKADADERQVGKVMDLSLGFLGGEGALAGMARNYGIYIEEDARQKMVLSFRAQHPKIVQLGESLVRNAQKAILNPDVTRWAGHVRYEFKSCDGALYCYLPDGYTTLRYPEARIEMKPAPWDKSQNIPNITALKAAYTAAADAKEWPRHGLWRGLLLENCVQASCAVLLKNALAECKKENIPVIFHVHDEIVAEVPEDDAEEAAAILKEIMEESPSWMPKLPLVAEPEIVTRYGK